LWDELLLSCNKVEFNPPSRSLGGRKESRVYLGFIPFNPQIMGSHFKMIDCFIYFLLLFTLVNNENLAAQALTENDQLNIVKCSDFEFNGQGDHACWDNTDWVSLTKGKNSGYNYKTRAKVLYSDTGIYFLFHCEDSIITSTLREDFADLWEEDVVEIFLWTDENHPFYFEYELSPTNYELPILVPNVEGTFLGWRPWHYKGERKTRHATTIEKEDGKILSWSAEFYIPYALLKPMSNVPPIKGTKWRANMYRIDYDNDVSTWTWQPIRTNFHDFEKFGTFIFN